mmetsp:Transcript_127114/g.301952  ORF Transcript_127114/g.301952 Transcript_127114/m.301952 type:complete len:334 (+) Transcript_127114:61-1062(+)
MMSPEGASSSHQVPGPQQAEVVGQPATLVKVSVPTGAVPGQQINFTMPNGQRVSTSVQEQVQAGATLTVSVPSPAPAAMAVAPTGSAMFQPGLAQARETLLPQPTVNAREADPFNAGMRWGAFGLGFTFCCFCGLPVGLCVWSLVALSHFCMPREDRDRNPRSYAPACASAVTAGVLCCCALLSGLMFLFVFALCGPFDMDNMDKMDSCPGLEKWINSTHMDHHHHWHPKRMSHNHMDHHHHWHPHWLRGSFHHESPPSTVSSPVFFDKAVEEETLGRPIPMGQHSIEEASSMVAAGAAPQSDREEASTAVSSPAVAPVATAAAAPAMPAMWF